MREGGNTKLNTEGDEKVELMEVIEKERADEEEDGKGERERCEAR